MGDAKVYGEWRMVRRQTPRVAFTMLSPMIGWDFAMMYMVGVTHTSVQDLSLSLYKQMRCKPVGVTMMNFNRIILGSGQCAHLEGMGIRLCLHRESKLNRNPTGTQWSAGKYHSKQGMIYASNVSLYLWKSDPISNPPVPVGITMCHWSCDTDHVLLIMWHQWPKKHRCKWLHHLQAQSGLLYSIF